MDDNRDIAFLAASCEREMKQTLAGSGLKYNKTDFRKFLGNGGNNYPQHPSYPHPAQYIPQQMYSQQPQQYYPPANPGYNNPIDPVIPEGVLPPPTTHFIPMPQGIAVPPQPGQSYGTSMESTGGFVMPNYNTESGKTYLEDEKEFRNALITEVKALKNNIKAQKTQLNKLTKTVESLILLLNKEPLQSHLETEIINDNPDQS
jgi:hypothetical protein